MYYKKKSLCVLIAMCTIQCSECNSLSNCSLQPCIVIHIILACDTLQYMNYTNIRSVLFLNLKEKVGPAWICWNFFELFFFFLKNCYYSKRIIFIYKLTYSLIIRNKWNYSDDCSSYIAKVGALWNEWYQSGLSYCYNELLNIENSYH